MNKQLRPYQIQALEFYADPDNYGEVYEDDEMDLGRMLTREDVEFDEIEKSFGYAGKKARIALKEI